ncbi:MAG TPA: hypothetical protein VGB53_02800 [Rubricoccaceae bacterium]|jgi:hypothetical protein
MRKRYQNAHTMHAAVLDLFDRRSEVWAGKTPAEETVARLQSVFERVAAVEAERQRMGTTGLTAEKTDARRTMEAATMRLVRAARPYARKIGDEVLLAEVDTSPNKLASATDAAAVGRAGRVLAATEDRIGEMAAYTVTKADVEALRVAAAAVVPAGAVRDSTGGQREARTEAFGPLFKETTVVLDDLDDVVESVVEDAEFRAEYARVRRTDDR